MAPSPQNLIAQAPAGTGKTAAFALAILNRIDPSQNVPQAIVICPTRFDHGNLVGLSPTSAHALMS